MFFDTRKGMVSNQYGAVGLKPHLDFNTSPYLDDETDSMGSSSDMQGVANGGVGF
jgi:hypothetical protein